MESAYFLSVNRNKKSITVNIRSEAGKRLIHELVQKVDVFVENYVPGKLAEMGLGYEQLSALNPRLVYASITGYGQTGPYASRPGYDVMIEAEAGLMYITGEEHGPPVKVGVAVTDLTTELYAHSAILATLFARNRTVATLANIGSSYLIAGKEASRMGTAHPSIVPYQVLQTRDSHIMIGAGNDGQFRTLCKVLRLDSLADNPLYKTNRDRVANRQDLIQIMTNRLKSENNQFWLRALEGKGVPFAPINNIGQTFGHPQVLARSMVQEIRHPKAGKIKVAGTPVKCSHTKPSIRTPPPLLGEHTDEVLKSILGYDSSRIQNLNETKAI
ncbi:CoA-transferase family III domain-containing protein [Dissophora ornata]|nr:CoA-transferase family III domain-containing protein [Dissophora ornata]